MWSVRIVGMIRMASILLVMGGCKKDSTWNRTMEDLLLSVDRGYLPIVVHQDAVLKMTAVRKLSDEELKSLEKYFDTYSTIIEDFEKFSGEFLGAAGDIKVAIELNIGADSKTLKRIKESFDANKTKWNQLRYKYVMNLSRLREKMNCDVTAAQGRFDVLDKRMEQLFQCWGKEIDVFVLLNQQMPMNVSAEERKKWRQTAVDMSSELEDLNQRFYKLAIPIIVTGDPLTKNLYKAHDLSFPSEITDWPLIMCLRNIRDMIKKIKKTD